MSIEAPVDLRCEYLIDPVGIDEPRPRFSWIVPQGGRTRSQRAYRIIVSSSELRALQGEGDIWDTGKVNSDETSNIPFNGSVLLSRQECFWRVCWWEQTDISSPWSGIARFEMGLLQETDWKGQWISRQGVKEFRSKGSTLLGEPLGDYVNSFTLYLRKEFRLKKRIARARAYVCGLGYYELRLNGSKVGDSVLDPAQTEYRKVALYSTYDVTSHLASGDACTIGVLLGNGRYIRSYGYDAPKLRMQLVVECEDGTVDSVATSSDWKVSYGPLQENGLYFGERYDARLEMPGWDEPSFDDSSWESAQVVAGVPVAAQMMEPIRVVQILSPRKWSMLSSGEAVYDFGQNFAGWVRLSVSGPAGTEVKLRHAELLNDDGSLNISPNQNAESTDVYTLRGEGAEAYEPRFTYHGFRYLEITADPALPSIISVLGCVVHSDVAEVGQFSCSHELINKIHRNILWGQRSNLMSIPTDCSQRDERQGWLGDAHLAAEESMFNFGMASFYTKFLRDIHHAQREDGSLPDTVPAYLGRLYPADPAWSAAYITIAWLMYQFYGDTRILGRYFDSMKKYVFFLRDHSDGLIVKTLGKYGDWCPPGSIAPKRTPVELTSTWYFLHDTVLLGRIAAAIGQEEDQRKLEALAINIRSAFNRTFLRDGEYEVNRFAPVDRSPGQTSNALPLYLDMVPPEGKAKVVERLLHGVVNEQDYHLDTGILGTRYLLDVLSDLGRTDVAFRVAVQRTYPGWGYMVEEGATTLWERWEKIGGGGMNSHNHIMLGSVDAWFYRVLAGLSTLAPAWKHIRFKPPVVQGLDSAQAEFRSVRGRVSVAWRRSAEEFLMAIVVPVGAVGTVYVPVQREDHVVILDGTTVWSATQRQGSKAQGCELVGCEEKYVLLNVGSGEYAFRVHRH
ncbi:MAG: alpha-L-rhamnosidase [Ignavibacteria bacterium GWA2_54_16]|nr:MAG: alpha-L-rhamnosidase [Ignavibacteria bacterium GWA2_54_16]